MEDKRTSSPRMIRYRELRAVDAEVAKRSEPLSEQELAVLIHEACGYLGAFQDLLMGKTDARVQWVGPNAQQELCESGARVGDLKNRLDLCLTPAPERRIRYGECLSTQPVEAQEPLSERLLAGYVDDCRPFLEGYINLLRDNTVLTVEWHSDIDTRHQLSMQIYRVQCLLERWLSSEI